MGTALMKKSLILACFVAALSLSSSAQGDEGFSEPMHSLSFDKEKSYYALIHTEKGVIKFLLSPEDAPISVSNFIQLSEGKFYDGLTFHKVVPGILVQGGDPTGKGDGGLDYTLPAEIGLKHECGSLALARLPDVVNPGKRSSGSQFYITLEDLPFIDGEYTVLGRAVEGLEVLKNIAPGDKITLVEIEIN
jgi:cyclophilin family peptidyl-prolyl cis-trans isomerase